MADDSIKNIRETRDLLKEVNGELGQQVDLIAASRKEYRKLESATKSLLYNADGTARLSDTQLKNQVKKAKIAAKEIQVKAQELIKSKRIRDLAREDLNLRTDITEEERALLRAAQQNFYVEQEILDLAEKELEIRKGVNKSMGLTGVLAKGLAKTLGVDVADHLQESRELAEQVNREFQDSSKSAGDFGKKLVGDIKVAFLNVKGLGQAIADTFLSADAIFAGIVKAFFRFNSAQAEQRKLSGQTAKNFKVIDESILNAADHVETITALSRELGMNVDAAFSQSTLNTAAEMTNLLGISEGATANLAILSEATGNSLDEVVDHSFTTARNMALSGKGAINFSQVIEDTEKISGKLRASLGQNPKLLIEAAAEARALGVSIEAIENSADSLLQFESSISAELEAELLTGKQINLEQARYFALTNKTAELTKEIGNNQEIISAYANGNRIAQQAIEKSLGLSGQEISQIIYKRQIDLGMSNEQAAAAAGINREEAERLKLQEQFQKSMEKLVMTAAPLVEKFAALLDNTRSMKTILVSLAALKMAPFLGQLASMGLSLAGISVSATTAASAITFGLAATAIIAGVVAMNAAQKKAQDQAVADSKRIGRMKDGVIDSSGGLVVSGPKGSYSLDTNDTIVANKNGVIAGTNLGGGGGNQKALMDKLDKLIAATERGRVIEMDGNLVGKSISNATSGLG